MSLLFFVFAAMIHSSVSPTTPSPQNEGTITLIVRGMKNNHGVVRAALFHSSNIFPSDKPFRGIEIAIKERQASVEIPHVPAGEYALAVFHDENNDGKLNQNFLGIPTEAYGFSNNARALFGPPAFEEAKFTVTNSSITITIEVK